MSKAKQTIKAQTIKNLQYLRYLKILANCTLLTACAILREFSNIIRTVNPQNFALVLIGLPLQI